MCSWCGYVWVCGLNKASNETSGITCLQPKMKLLLDKQELHFRDTKTRNVFLIWRLWDKHCERSLKLIYNFCFVPCRKLWVGLNWSTKIFHFVRQIIYVSLFMSPEIIDQTSFRNHMWRYKAKSLEQPWNVNILT